jgi:hypothetical protein
MEIGKWKWIILGAFILIVSVGLLASLFLSSKQEPNSNVSAKPTATPGMSDSARVTGVIGQNNAIAKVGTEYIYQSDLDAELRNFPAAGEELKKTLLDKIIRDSQTLQIAQRDQIATPDATIYNNPQKNYMNRTKEVEQAKKKLQQKLARIKGTVITVWFINDHVGILGYERARQIAQDTITLFHDQVKAGTITIEEAGKRIQNDASLGRIDPSYKENAFFVFDVAPDENITREPNFDTALKSLEVGGVSDVFIGKSYDFAKSKTEKYEAYFLFGQVQGKNMTSEYADIDEYLNQESKNIDVTIY